VIQIDCSNNIYKHDITNEIRIEISEMNDKEVCKLVHNILKDKYRDAVRINFEVREQDGCDRIICSPEFQYDI